jgi:hypothetical protein
VCENNDVMGFWCLLKCLCELSRLKPFRVLFFDFCKKLKSVQCSLIVVMGFEYFGDKFGISLIVRFLEFFKF